MKTEYCQLCGIAINIPTGIMSMFNKNVTFRRFKDGYYCENCAKLKVDKDRTTYTPQDNKTKNENNWRDV